MSIERRERGKFNLEIKSATEEDLSKINEIDNRPEEHEEKMELQEKGEGKFFVIRSGEEIAGYVFIYYDHQSAHFPEIQGPFLEDLVISPKFRKMGLGKTLLDNCEEEIKESGGKELHLAVLSDNQEAIDFYTKNGYIEIPNTKFKPPRQDDIDEGIHGTYYEKELVQSHSGE